MLGRYRILSVVVALGSLALHSPVWANQTPGHEQGLPDPIPPPLPKPKPPKDAGNYEPILPETDQPWKIDPELLEKLFEKANIYRDYTKRFTCNEVARVAEYDAAGAVTNERVRRYGYLLTTSASGESINEFRQEIAKDGSLKQGQVKDAEPFPPAYAWVFLFSRFNEPYFGLRYVGERFDGFDWVHEIQFKGSMPFTDGKDIRQWEGVILIDAVTHNPLEIRSEPSGQRERIASLYRRWSGSFNLLGMRTAPKPLGFRARIEFRHKREGLAFPTELRYDTFRAVTPTRIVPTQASTRAYDGYRIFKPEATQQLGQNEKP